MILLKKEGQDLLTTFAQLFVSKTVKTVGVQIHFQINSKIIIFIMYFRKIIVIQDVFDIKS